MARLTGNKDALNLINQAIWWLVETVYCEYTINNTDYTNNED